MTKEIIDMENTNSAKSEEFDPTPCSQGDWPEDFEHENGCYGNKCMVCGSMFIGYKRRVVCKTCHTEKEEWFNSLSDEEKERVKAEEENAIKEFFANNTVRAVTK